MNKYSFFKKIIHSFYSKEVYAYVGKKEINKTGLRYLVVLISVLWIPEVIKMQISINRFINTELPVFVNKMPTMHIINGNASFDTPSPTIITDEKGKALIIFDTSDVYTSLDSSEAKVLVSKSKIIFRNNTYETREYSFLKIEEFTLAPDEIISWAHWGNYLFIFIYLLIVSMAFVYRAFIALCYSLVGLIFQTIIKTNYSFQTIYRLSILSFTPAYIVDKIFQYFDFNFSGWAFICVLASCSFLFFGIQATKEKDESMEEQEQEKDNT